MILWYNNMPSIPYDLLGELFNLKLYILYPYCYLPNTLKQAYLCQPLYIEIDTKQPYIYTWEI